MLEAMARIASSQPNEAIARIASRKNSTIYKDRVNAGPHGPFNNDRVNTGPHGPFNYPGF